MFNKKSFIKKIKVIVISLLLVMILGGCSTELFIEYRTLTVTVEPEGKGEILIEPDKEKYALGEEVSLTAQPDSGYVFSQWLDQNDNIIGAASSININMTEDKQIKAVFAEEQATYQVNVNVNDSNCGSVSPNQTNVVEGNTVELTATPETGYKFVRWEDSSNTEIGTDNPINLTINSNSSFIAVFDGENILPDIINDFSDWSVSDSSIDFGSNSSGGRNGDAYAYLDTQGSLVSGVTNFDPNDWNSIQVKSDTTYEVIVGYKTDSLSNDFIRLRTSLNVNSGWTAYADSITPISNIKNHKNLFGGDDFTGVFYNTTGGNWVTSKFEFTTPSQTVDKMMFRFQLKNINGTINFDKIILKEKIIN